MSASRNYPSLAVNQSLLDAIEHGITIFNPDYELVAWNRVYESMGISEPGTIRPGLSLLDNYRHIARRGVFGPGDPETIANERWAMARAGTSPPAEDLHATDGRIIEIRRYFLPGIGVAAVFTDITGARQAEERARRAESLAQLGRVAGGLAHDFNNLLTVIIGNLEAGGPDGTQEALSAAQRGAELCRTSLALSARQPRFDAVLDVTEVIEEAATFIRRVLPETIEVELEVEPEMPAIRTDRTRLTSALLNLALNGRDAMPDGGRLCLECRSTDDGVRIAVHDEGIGMDAETLARIRAPFFSTKRDQGGTGLGLEQVRRFVGDLHFTSSLGRGTTVSFELPHADSSLRRCDEAVSAGSIDARILLVEDEEPVREAIETMLESLGARITAVATSARAKELVLSDPPDLLFTDYLLSDEDTGLQLAEFARARIPALPVILCSGYQDIDVDPKRARVTMLAKPFDLRSLRNVVDRALRTGCEETVRG